MGLLDFFGDPQANMAMAAGLLGGGNFGQALGRGLAGGQAVMAVEEERRRRNELALAQAEELRSRAEERQMKIGAANRLDRMTSGLFRGDGQSSASGNQASAQQQAASWLARASLDDVAALKVAGGPDLTEQWKLMHIGSSVPAGTYRMMGNGQREYMVDPSKPFTVTNGQIGLAPGAANVPLFQGAVKEAEQMGTNRQTLAPLDRIDPTTNRPYPSTVGQLVQQVQPEQALRQQTQGGMGNTASDYAREIAQTRASLQNPNLDPASRKMLEDHLRVTLDQSARAAPDLSVTPSRSTSFNGFAGPADTTRAVKQAEADVSRGEATKTKLTKADEMLYGIARAKSLLGEGPTESLAGAGIDKAMSLVGKSTKSADVASQLEALSGWLVSNVPRMEGPQSNFDVDNYKTMAGKVGDRTLPISARLAAANEVEKLQRKYANLNNDQPAEPNQTKKRISLNDIAETARKSGRTTAEVTAAARAKGYEIGGD